jgi:glycine/D-amino acid oxidase-like deaminating enzyme
MTDYRSKSWWLESLPEAIEPNPQLTTEDSADVVIIGGGYTGLSTGYHLKQINPGLDMAPAIGYLGEDKKAIFSLGCIGHGVSMTTLNGRTIAELICGRQTSRTEMFFVGRKVFPWPPELISFGTAHAIRGFMKLEDRLYYK